MNVDMPALDGVTDHAANILAILYDRIASLEGFQRNLVADRNIVPCGQLHGAIILGEDTKHLGAGLQAFDDNDTDVIFRAMNKKVRI